MCNDYGNRITYKTYLEAFNQLKIKLVAPGTPLNLELRHDIWPTDKASVIRAARRDAGLTQLRWGFPPGRPKGPPVINKRSEKRRFPRGRCLVPASHFYEFTGKRSPKDRWRFTDDGEEWFCIAGPWKPVEGGEPSLTMPTCEPGADVVPVHSRQVVVLGRQQWASWLDPGHPEAELLRPSPSGFLHAERVR